jgi:pyruvate formate-lyase/glycerol dehydratase family glycyl radical enzyme
MLANALSPQEERILEQTDESAREEAYVKRARVKRMLAGFRDKPPRMAVERARFFTESFKETQFMPLVVRWALAEANVAKNIPIYIGPDELIVGRAGPPGRYSVLYPEFEGGCFGELEKIQPTHKEAPIVLTEEDARVINEELVPYWKGKTLLEGYASLLPEETDRLLHIDGDIYTSRFLMRQTAANRHSLQWVPDYEKVLKRGTNDIKKEAEQRLASLNPYDPKNNFDKSAFYRAVIIVCDGIAAFSKRYADLAKSMAQKETNKQRKKELLKIAQVCERVPVNPARTFHEAVQAQWFFQLYCRFEHDGSLLGNGRIDQYLYPHYKKDKEKGQLTDDEALELLECLWLNIAQSVVIYITPHGLAFGQQYAHFEATTLGGQTKDGHDATNELSYLILQSKKEFPLPYPDLSVRIHSGTPDQFLLKTCEVIKEGTGFPKLFNDEEIIPIYLSKGATLEEARDYAISGCTESRLPNRETYLTGGPHINMGTMVEMALNDGRLRLSNNEQLGLSTGDPRGFKTFEDVWHAFIAQADHIMKNVFTQQYIADTVRPYHVAAPVYSCVHDLCMQSGKDLDRGKVEDGLSLGYFDLIGFGTAIDSLAAVKKLVYDDKSISMNDLLDALDGNFEGKEAIRQLCLNAPKYGNNDPYVDSIGRRIEEHFGLLAKNYTTAYGGEQDLRYVPVTIHIPCGAVTGATPNGRKAGEPLSEGVSPSQGCDINGPTSTLLSIRETKAAEYNSRAARLLNLKLSPQVLAGEDGTKRLASFVRSWCDQKHWHIQFNVINKETMLDAQRNPDKYRNLIVRVAGYSAYFVDLSPELQNEIIARTQHQTA